MASWNRWSSAISRTRSGPEDYVGVAGRNRLGKKKWEQAVRDVVARLIAALEPEDVVLGGGNVKKLKKLPLGRRAGDNADAFVEGFRVWHKTKRHNPSMARREPSREPQANLD